ncbi:hypothetical protein ACFWTE_15035 [Nocardiopsis sp. NPDC058631]|uniref:hypothetical protein n=1 Tax=Nocardiopsis sp. NPDC058631 TaxID=3346566 RepID=UPI00366413FE
MDTFLGTLARDSAREIRVFYPATIGARTALRTASARTLASGLKVQVVSDRRNLADAALRGAIRQQRDCGARIRVADSVPHYLALVDHTLAVIASQGKGDNERVTVLREQTMVSGMRTLFDLAWRSATPLDAVPENADDTCETISNVLTNEIIRLLSEGLSDEDAARELGTSLRTFRRHVAGIKEMVNARNRFQTAVRLTQRGLL